MFTFDAPRLPRVCSSTSFAPTGHSRYSASLSQCTSREDRPEIFGLIAARIDSPLLYGARHCAFATSLAHRFPWHQRYNHLCRNLLRPSPVPAATTPPSKACILSSLVWVLSAGSNRRSPPRLLSKLRSSLRD